VVCAATPGFIVTADFPTSIGPRLNRRRDGGGRRRIARISKREPLRLRFRYAVMGLLEFIDGAAAIFSITRSAILEGALGSDSLSRTVGDPSPQGTTGRIDRSGAGFLDYSGLDVDAYLERVCRVLV